MKVLLNVARPFLGALIAGRRIPTEFVQFEERHDGSFDLILRTPEDRLLAGDEDKPCQCK